MPKIVFIHPDGQRQELQATAGRSVMHNAVADGVPGILGDCGGCCNCATCHVYIDAAWRDRLPPAAADELMMLKGALDVLPSSRLCCQILVTEALDGLELRLPSSQT